MTQCVVKSITQCVIKVNNFAALFWRAARVDNSFETGYKLESMAWYHWSEQVFRQAVKDMGLDESPLFERPDGAIHLQPPGP